MVRVVLLGSDFGEPIVVPPGTPPELIKALRSGYAAALKDPELLADAKKAKMDVEFVSGEELESLAQEAINQPADVLERVKKILAQ